MNQPNQEVQTVTSLCSRLKDRKDIGVHLDTGTSVAGHVCNSLVQQYVTLREIPVMAKGQQLLTSLWHHVTVSWPEWFCFQIVKVWANININNSWEAGNFTHIIEDTWTMLWNWYDFDEYWSWAKTDCYFPLLEPLKCLSIWYFTKPQVQHSAILSDWLTNSDKWNFGDFCGHIGITLNMED